MTKLVNLLTRTLSGIVYVAIILGSLQWSPHAFAVVMAFAMLVCMHEFYGISRKLGVKPQYVLGVIAAAAMFAVSYAVSVELCGASCALMLILLLMLIFFVELFRKSAAPFNNIAYTLLPLIYVAMPFSLMNLVYSLGGENLMFCFFILLWANDTFAYLFGITLGRRKLFPSISPKKSWEGYVGGILSVVVISYVLHCMFDDVALRDMVAMGIIISTTAVLADLVESMLKRSAGVKDSGKIMPGHGGLLDRFDATLLSLPLVFVYVVLFM